MNEPMDFIHRFIPAAGGEIATSPTVLLLHGTGGNEDDLLDLDRSLAPHANFLSPRGKTSENGMPRFFRRLAEGVFDEIDLSKRTYALADFISAAAKEYGFPAEDITASWRPGISSPPQNWMRRVFGSPKPTWKRMVGPHGLNRF